MSDVAGNDPTRRRVPRWVWVALIASLAINLFVVGVVARAFWPHHGAPIRGGLLGQIMTYSKELPVQRRTAILKAAGAEQPFETLRPLRDEVRAARREVVRMFAAEPFDRPAFVAAEEKLQAVEGKSREAVVKIVADIAAGMSASERAGFLKWRDAHMLVRGHRGDHAPGTDTAPKKP